MTNLFRNAMDWLGKGFKAKFSESVVYRRDTDEMDLSAIVGEQTLLETEVGGLRTLYEACDFRLLVADMVLGSLAFTPQAQDQIDWNGNTYAVLDMPGIQPYEVEPTGTIITVHTKRIPEGAAA